MSLSFAKEAVQPVHATTGLLSSTLALTRSESLGSSVNVTNSSGASSSSTQSAPSTSSSPSSASLSKHEFSAARQRTLYTVANVSIFLVLQWVKRVKISDRVVCRHNCIYTNLVFFFSFPILCSHDRVRIFIASNEKYYRRLYPLWSRTT